jgi:glycosyltransferase involved in cell wall biosynthesis
MDLLHEALQMVETSPDSVQLAVFGHSNSKLESDLDMPVNNLGFVDESVLRRLYSDADVVVVPSRQEAFGQTASEALACGTPVVAFNSTGPKEIVSHKETGYLAEPFDPADLARGIDWVLSNDERREILSKRARSNAVEKYSIEKVVEQYLELYEEQLLTDR